MIESELIPFEQGQIIGLLLEEEEFCRTYIDHMKANLFSEIYRSVFLSIKEYWKKYNHTIPMDILCKEIIFREGDGFTEEKKNKIFQALASFKVDDRSIEYVTKSLERFITMQSFANNLAELVKQTKNLKNEVDFVDKITPLVRNVEGSLSPIVSVKPEMAYADLDERTDYRMRVHTGDIVRKGISTGIKQLDDLLPFDGMENGWIGIVVGPTGRGKSIYLLQMAYAASVLGNNVVFLTLELSNSMLLDRYDALVSFLPVASIFENANLIRGKINEEKDNPVHGKDWGEVAFLDFSAKPITIPELKSEIQNLKNKYNFDTHLLVVDYLDLLKPDRFSKEGGWKDQQALTVGLRQMGNDLGFPVWTASQANRGAGAKVEDDQEIDLDSIAESYSKVSPADLVVTINQKKADKDSPNPEKKMVLNVAKNRNGATSSIAILSDFSRMRFYVGDYENDKTLTLKDGTYTQ